MRLSMMSLLCFVSLVAVASASDSEDICHTNDRYSVLEVPNDDAPGARFFVSVGTGALTCDFDESGPSQIVGDGEDPLWFSELTGRFLVLTRSTGPQGDLLVFDLESGTAVLDVPADDFEVHEGGVTFWQRTAEATANTCPDFARYAADGFGAVIVERAHFDFGSGGVDRTGEERCDPVQ